MMDAKNFDVSIWADHLEVAANAGMSESFEAIAATLSQSQRQAVDDEVTNRHMSETMKVMAKGFKGNPNADTLQETYDATRALVSLVESRLEDSSFHTRLQRSYTVPMQGRAVRVQITYGKDTAPDSE